MCYVERKSPYRLFSIVPRFSFFLDSMLILLDRVVVSRLESALRTSSGVGRGHCELARNDYKIEQETCAPLSTFVAFASQAQYLWFVEHFATATATTFLSKNEHSSTGRAVAAFLER